MRQFDVFKHPSGNMQAVKQGACWPAFFFGFFWALVAKLWMVATVAFVSVFALSLVFYSPYTGNVAGNVAGNIMSLIVGIILCMYGNSWRKNDLLSRGYELQGTFEAENKDSAIALCCTGSDGVVEAL